jgi:hypothetical protein
MRRSRRLAVALAVSGLVAAGTFGATQLVAHATVAGTCTGYADGAFCSVDETINAPTSISVSVTAKPEQWGTFNYTLTCTQNGQSTTTSGSDALLSPPTATVSLALPYSHPSSCTIAVNGNLPDEQADNVLTLTVSYTTGSSTSSSGSGPVPLVSGYDGRCLDAKGNSSANGTKVILWTCNSSDSAQGWTFTNGELRHNGKCANDQASGGSGSKVVLWTCNGASNEKWAHTGGDGEFLLNLASHGFVCLDDPGYSKTNGTQVIVYACRNGGNQHWSV